MKVVKVSEEGKGGGREEGREGGREEESVGERGRTEGIDDEEGREGWMGKGERGREDRRTERYLIHHMQADHDN